MRGIYVESTMVETYLMTLAEIFIHNHTQSWFPFIKCCRLSWHLCKSILKSFSIVSSASHDFFVVTLSPLIANPTKWPNKLKQFVGKLPTNCLSVFGHFVNLALKGLKCIRGFSWRKEVWWKEVNFHCQIV